MNERGHLSSFTLDRLLLQSLPEAETAEARAHLEACAECRSLLSQMEADRKKFEGFVFARTLPAVTERARRVPLLSRLSLAWRIALPAAAAAGLALVVAFAASRGPGPERNRVDEPYLGIKGGPTLQVFAARGESVFPVKEGTRLRPGDRIRFVAQRDEGDGFLLIASLDGARKVSAYFPAGGEASAPLARGRVELPGSIELDGTPGRELVLAFFSPSPLSLTQVRPVLERWPEPARLDAQVVALSFEKEAGR